ncbi:MAG: PPC domain-containing protein [Polyangiales bacterium]
MTVPETLALEAPTYVSFETALRVEPDGQPVLTDELHAAQVDYYVFHAIAGAYYEISTENDIYSPDNVLTLFDAERKEVASNDSGSRYPDDVFDARLVVRIPVTGDYYVRIEDHKTPPEFFRSRFPLLFYHLNVRTIAPDTAGYVRVEDGRVPARFESDTRDGYRFVTLIGEFHGEVERIALDGARDQALIARFHPGGVAGDGSTVDHPRVRVSAPDGHVLAAIESSASREYIRPPVSEGSHQIELTTQGPLGANAFYAIDLVLLDDNPAERNESENHALGGAEVLRFTRGNAGRALLLARVPPGDVDYFEVPADGGRSVVVSCEGESTGSGVRGLSADLVDASGHLLASGAEGDDGILLRVSLESRLPHYLRLHSDHTEAPESIEAWVRCAVLIS